jgi:leucine dehydrogenase
MVEAALRRWDGELLVTSFDRLTGAWIVVAIHSTRLGPATGGTRMKAYPDLAVAVEDATRLAEGMTFKFAVTGFPRGGGKAVIAISEPLGAEERRGLLRRYGTIVHRLGGLYYTGPDVGTGPEDMDVIAETGAPYVHSRTPLAGGAGDSAPATAIGTFEGIRTVCGSLYDDDSLFGRSVVVQGAGHVGRVLIRLLRDAGADVRFTDTDERIVGEVIRELGVASLPPESVYDEPCDIFSPCALGGILRAETIERLRCRAVAGCANNQLATEEDALRLQRRGILYAPDFVLSLGGAMAITGIEAMGWPPEEAELRVIETVRTTLRRVFHIAGEEGVSTVEAARRIADERLRAVTP